MAKAHHVGATDGAQFGKISTSRALASGPILIQDNYLPGKPVLETFQVSGA